MRSELFVKKGQGGMFSVVNNAITTGSIFWVDSNTGSDAAGFGRNPDAPVATLDYAIGLCTASKGDRIYVFAQHAETKTTTPITMDVAGVSVIGLMNGTQRPMFTTTTAMDVITITAADCTIENLGFAAPGVDSVTADINVAAANCAIRNTLHHGSGNVNMNKVSIITCTADANDCLIEGVRIYNDTVILTGGGIVLEGASARTEIRDVFIHAEGFGIALGAICDTAGGAATGVYIHDCVIGNFGATLKTLDFTNNSVGVCRNVFINGRHTTIASNIVCGSSMAFCETYYVEEAAKSAILAVAVDAE